MPKRFPPLSYIVIFVVLLAVIASSAFASVPADFQGTLSSTEPSVTQPSDSTNPSIPETTPSEPSQPATDPTESTAPKQEFAKLDVSGVTARDAFVYDCRTGEYLHLTGDPHQLIYPASVTKLFSVYVALMYLSPDREVTVGEILTTVPSDSSSALLNKGDRLTVADLVRGMLLPSGGDAARVLAVAVGKELDGTTDKTEFYYFNRFVEEMNTQARLLGMTDSHFVNSDGYHDDDHYISMADAVRMAQLCMEVPIIMEIAATRVYRAKVLNTGREILWVNTNKMISEKEYPELYSSQNIGLKTGYTSDAGGCMLSVFKVEGGYQIIGVFGCDGRDPRFTDTLKLFKAANA